MLYTRDNDINGIVIPHTLPSLSLICPLYCQGRTHLAPAGITGSIGLRGHPRSPQVHNYDWLHVRCISLPTSILYILHWPIIIEAFPLSIPIFSCYVIRNIGCLMADCLIWQSFCLAYFCSGYIFTESKLRLQTGILENFTFRNA